MKKLDLKDLQVTSFATSEKSKVQGGNTDVAVCGPGFTERPTMCTDWYNWCISPC